MGLFITFEGGEGSGKSTQIQLLEQALVTHRIPVITTREPGGTQIGEAIRSVILDPLHTAISDSTEMLLFQAARAQLTNEVIRPALERGLTVICDRFGDSTQAYQGFGHGRDLEDIRRIENYATGGLIPDLTYLLDIDVRSGLARKRNCGPDEWNRMEAKALEFHERVRRGYLTLAQEDPTRWQIIDANQPLDKVHLDIMGPFNERFA